jgi:hypothetical protein
VHLKDRMADIARRHDASLVESRPSIVDGLSSVVECRLFNTGVRPPTNDHTTDHRRGPPTTRPASPLQRGGCASIPPGRSLGRALAAALAAPVGWALGIPFLVLAGFFLFFFRDPERLVNAAADAVLSPADGRVVADPQGKSDFSRRWMCTSTDPVSGVAWKVEFRRGKFLPAYREDAAPRTSGARCGSTAVNGRLSASGRHPRQARRLPVAEASRWRRATGSES